MQLLQLRHGECSAKGWSLLQWHYFSKKCPVACDDDIDIIARTKLDVTAAFNAIERESTKIDLMTCGVSVLRLRPITILLIQSRNLFILTPPVPPSLEIKCGITNRCYYGLKSKKPCHRLVRPTGVGAQEAESPERMCCGRPKSVNQVVMVI